ncbi:exlusion protein FxsA [Vibrio cholerae]|nr:exlusion protein FxsA [Vibrio cholerae]MBO1371818.1 exlusion protein FxsA [Vibrio cholerae]MBO1375586.1 exlusion protein FxsA [Vibrio cholerae]MBO1379284.1 exlusion protein FxsA [Vibrio cholerae]MBO1409093.1 exlusion protein FxsA [Vibrio cholerae]
MSTRSVSSPIEQRWFRLLCLSLVVMRCQPLRRALCYESKLTQILFFAVTEEFL